MSDAAQAVDGAPQEAPQAPQAPAWKSQLAGDLQSQNVFDQFGTLNDFARSYLDIQSQYQQAQQAPRIPGAEASDEELAAFRQAMGIPDGPDGYEFQIENAPEEVSFDEFKQLAHELNLTADQAQRLAQWDIQRRASEQQASEAQRKASRDEALKHLQESHGEQWESKLEKALRLVERAGGAELRAELNDTGIGNNPKLIDTFIKIAEMTSDDGIVFGGATDKSRQLDFRKIYPSHYQ